MAIDGTYEVAVDLGKRQEKGTVLIVSEGKSVRFTVNAPLIGKVEAAGSVGPDDSFSASGKTRVLFKRVTYSISGRVNGDKLTAVCETNMGSANVTGTRIK